MRQPTLFGNFPERRVLWLTTWLLVGGCFVSATVSVGDFATMALISVIIVTPLAYYQTIVLVAVPILAAPLLGRTGESMIGPFNAMSIVALWFLGLGSLVVLTRFKTVIREKLFVILLALLVVTGLSVLVSPVKGLSASETVRMASAILMFPLAYQLSRNPARRRQIVLLVFLSAVIPVGVGFYQIVSGDIDFGAGATPFELESGIKRIYATFYDVHPFAKYLMVLLPLALIMMLLEHRSKEAKMAWVAVFVALFANLIYTYARSQLLGFLVMSLIILYKLKMINIKTVFLILPLVVGLFAATGVIERFGDIAQPIQIESQERENSLKGRLLIWREGIPRALNQPVLGHGAATFAQDIGIQSHNVYLGLFYELGVLGPLLYFWALIHAAKVSSSCFANGSLSAFDRKLALAVSSLSLGIAVVSIAENYVQATVMWWMYYALLGCVMSSAGDSRCVD